MLPNNAEFNDQTTRSAEAAFSLDSGTMTERFREQCLHRLRAEPARTPHPIGRGGRSGAAANDDPAVSAIEEWRAARHSYLAHRLEIEPLWNAVPEWVRNWHGVYAGRTESTDGKAVPVMARTEKTLHDCYDRRVREAATPEAAQRIESRRCEALAELRLALAAEKGACSVIL